MAIDEGWRSYSAAPPRGTRICASQDVIEGDVLSMVLESENGMLPLLVTRRHDKLRVFVNACPHQYLPLDYQGSNLLSADGSMLMCNSHGARFLIDDGECVDGPAMGCALDLVPVEERAGEIWVGA
jgi:nitrite reductase/ring-hydroxylating ferredoxin subunit